MYEYADQGIQYTCEGEEGHENDQVSTAVLKCKAKYAIRHKKEAEQQNCHHQKAKNGVGREKKYLVQVERICGIHDKAIHGPQEQTVKNEDVKKE
jgi:hypothetical protein